MQTEGNYQQQSSYQMEVNGLFTNLPKFVMHMSGYLNNSESYLVTVDRENMNDYLTNRTSSVNEFFLKKAIIEKNFYTDNGNAMPINDPDKKGCGPEPGCSVINHGLCSFSGIEYYCDPAGCDVLRGGEITNTTPNTCLLYTVRTHLEESNIGNKYETYYYAISNVTVDGMTSTTAGQIMAILPTMYSIGTKMMDPSTYGSDIPIDTQTASDLKDFFDYMRDLYDNADYRTIIDDVKDDVDNFKGKTVNEILSAV